MKQQTAVEWLIGQLKQYDFADIKDDENYIIKIPAWVLTEKEEQAKQMEKEQIKYAYYYDPNCDEIKDDAEQYYQETYDK